MKFLKCLVLSVVLALAGCNSPAPTVRTPDGPTMFTPQQKATHMIRLMRGRDDGGICTGTAIGVHALLTATHCNDSGEGDGVRLDQSLRIYHIQKVLTDDRDHDIYLIDGPELVNTIEYKVRQTVIGEHVYLWGNGGGEYPARKLEGKSFPSKDPSDVDEQQGQAYFTMPVIGGDSGSVVFADDDFIVAVTTYSYIDRKKKEHYTIDFTPNFTPEQIEQAKSYVPVAFVEKKIVKKPERQMTLMDLLGR